MRFTDVSKKVFRSKCAVTRAVDNLEKAGLVKRKLMDEDRREKRVAITEKGVEFIDQTMHQRRLISSEIMSDLNENNMNELISLLRHVRRHVRSLFRESDEPYPQSNRKRRGS
jgi:DNA-binding MarR family transcriptional regulator